MQVILEHLLQTVESEIVEFKEAKQNFDSAKLGKYFSALSNEANLKNVREAWLVFGVNDQRRIVGTSYRPSFEELNKLKPQIADHTTARLTFKDIHEINTPQGRVLLFQIPAAPQGLPIAWKGHYYGRDGEQLNALNLEELERIRCQSTKDWSAEICEQASIDDLSTEALQLARKLYQEKHPHLASAMTDWDDITFLNKAKLCIQGKITHTAILLLGKPESEHFLQPALARISWILKDRDNIPKDYQHFSCPFLLSAQSVFQKIRVLKYRYMQEGSLFPEEIDQYDPFIIREALNNCIAHQDYTLAGKINVVEREDDCLIFTNEGQFIPQTVEAVLYADAPETRYRNPFLTQAMVNLKLIDTIGSGILRMFRLQQKRFFPMPDYQLTGQRVAVTIVGKVLDLNYARQLARKTDLSLDDIILLDRVQKKKELTTEQVKYLRQQRLIEGRKPNLHISSNVAKEAGLQPEYIRMKGMDDEYYQQLIIQYLEQFSSGNRATFEEILMDKLPEVLSDDQKKHKVKNLLQSMKKQRLISIEGKSWHLNRG